MGRSIFGGDHASVTEVSVLFFTRGSTGGWVGGFLGAAQGEGKKKKKKVKQSKKFMSEWKSHCALVKKLTPD